MALPSSGLIKFSQIQTEFGGTDPIKLSEYYGSDTVPSSGLIKMSDFYGTTAEKLIPRSAVQSNPPSMSRALTGGVDTWTSIGFGTGSSGYITFAYEYERFALCQNNFTFTNLFNIAGISAADVGKTIQIWYDHVTPVRQSEYNNTNTATVNDTVGGRSVSYAANGASGSASSGWMTAGIINASGNGSCVLFVSHANGQSTSQFAGEVASGTIIQHYLWDNGTANVFRIT